MLLKCSQTRHRLDNMPFNNQVYTAFCPVQFVTEADLFAEQQWNSFRMRLMPWTRASRKFGSRSTFHQQRRRLRCKWESSYR
jgi:hypothetical protein